MTIIAFAGSNASASINKTLVNYTAQQFPTHAIEYIDFNDYPLPFYTPEEQAKGIPAGVYHLLDRISKADAIICSLAEYNGNFTGALKNTIDWLSRLDRRFFQDKPMLLMSTTPGSSGGKAVLSIAEKTFTICGADIKAIFSLPQYGHYFHPTEGITHPEFKTAHAQAVQALSASLS